MDSCHVPHVDVILPGMTDAIVFDEVQIGKGVKPLAQHGFAIVSEGTLTLQGSDRTEIDSAPLREVSAKPVRMTRGKTLSVQMNDTKYMVSPGWGEHVGTVNVGDREIKSAAKHLKTLIDNG